MIKDEYVVVLIRKPYGEEWELEIEKDYDDDLGLEFENDLMSEYKSCSNKCLFCFLLQGLSLIYQKNFLKKIQDIKDVKNYQYIQIKTYVQNSAYNINIKLRYITDKLQTFESTYVDSNFSSQHLTIVLAIQQSNF